MTMFAQKLSRLTDTIALVGTHGAADLGDAMAQGRGRGRIAIAIGSGLSGVAAAYFAQCRTTLGLGATRILTPMQFLLSLETWVGVDVWLFSVEVDDPDLLAALRCAVSSGSDSVRLISVRKEEATARAALQHPASDLFVLPVADREDAVHGTIAMVTTLLIASDGLTERPHGQTLLDVLRNRTCAALMNDVDAVVDAFRPNDTMIVGHDPQLTPIAMLVEDALWTSGIAPVQRTDFRGLARGRDIWATRDGIFLLTLTTVESEAVWHSIATAIPQAVRRGTMMFGNGGRLANAVGIIKGFAVIARLGELSGVDPAPLRGHAIAVAEDDAASLSSLLEDFTPAVRHKARV